MQVLSLPGFIPDPPHLIIIALPDVANKNT